MNIEQARFIANPDGENDVIEIMIDGITMCVPINPDNRHYQAIQEWVAEGNTIVNERNTPPPEPTAEELQKAADKQSAHDKLSALGLTDAEIEAITR